MLIPFADAFAAIQTASYESATGAEQVNEMLKWLSRIDNTDWIPPAILFMAKSKSDPRALYRFFAALERLAAFLMICRYGINERIERYGKLLNAIADNCDLDTAESPLQLSDAECKLFVKELNGSVYRQVPKRRLYILLRLDSALSDGSATYDHSVISIEHVLPQSPSAGSQWCDWFPTPDQRDHWVHRLGNLLLLNHKKNSSASNYDFDKKKLAYFTKGGVSPFPLTTQAVAETMWTPQVIERRQRSLLDKLRQLWLLNVAPSEDEPDVAIDSDYRKSRPDSTQSDTADIAQTADAEKSGGNTPWLGYWFVNVGDGRHRNWDDCRKYGFLSAGQGQIYGEAMKKLKVGDRVFAYMKGNGYVGFGTVTHEAVMAKDFKVDGQCLFDLPLVQPGIKENGDTPELSEWPVGIKWNRTYPRDQAKTFSGAFANPNIVCILRDERTVAFLKQQFGVEEN